MRTWLFVIALLALNFGAVCAKRSKYQRPGSVAENRKANTDHGSTQAQTKSKYKRPGSPTLKKKKSKYKRPGSSKIAAQEAEAFVCKDTSPDCPRWMGNMNGDCRGNDYRYMLQNCPITCDMCSEAEDLSQGKEPQRPKSVGSPKKKKKKKYQRANVEAEAGLGDYRFDDPKADHRKMAVTLGKEKKKGLAVKAAQAAVRFGGKGVDYLNLGVAFMESASFHSRDPEDYDRAEDAFKKAEEFDPNQKFLDYNIRNLHRSMKADTIYTKTPPKKRKKYSHQRPMPPSPPDELSMFSNSAAVATAVASVLALYLLQSTKKKSQYASFVQTQRNRKKGSSKQANNPKARVPETIPLDKEEDGFVHVQARRRNGKK